MAIEFDTTSPKFAEYAEPGRLVTTEWLAERLGTTTRFIRRIVAERRIAYTKVPGLTPGMYDRVRAAMTR